MFLNARVQISPWAAGTGNCRMLWHRLRAWPGRLFAGELACGAGMYSWRLAKDPFPLWGSMFPSFCFWVLLTALIPASQKAALPDVGSRLLVMGRDAFITQPQELEQPFPSCVHHAPPDSMLPSPELAASSACWRGRSQQCWLPQLPVGYWVLKDSGALEAAG